MENDKVSRNLGAGLIVLALLIAATVFIFYDVEDESSAAPVIDSVQADYEGNGLAEPPEGGTELAAGDPEEAPEFEIATIDGKTFSLAEHLGEVVVLNFWATWCAPCRVEIPDLIEMQKELEDRVQFVGISIDHDGEEVVRDFAEKMDMNYPVALDDGTVADMYGGIYGLPTTVVIDKSGMIQRKIPGLVTRSELMPILTALVEMS